MMQVTGNNKSQKELILSIRLTPNGLYFDVNQAKQTWVKDNLVLSDPIALERVLKKNKLLKMDFTQVKVSVLSKDSGLVPQEFDFVAQDIKVPDGCELICSEPCGGAVELMMLPLSIKEALEARFEGELSYVSSLMEISALRAKKTCFVAMYGDISSLVITENEKILLAQHLPTNNHADILYYLSVFEQDAKDNIEIVFDSSDSLRRKLKSYYKNIIIRKN